MIKKIFVFSSLLLATAAIAQQKSPAAKYASVITPAALKEKLSVIAGPAMEGRETATPGQKKAAAYIENYFKKIGLQPGTPNGYQVQYPVYQDSLLSASLSINGEAAGLGSGFTLSPAFLAEGNWHAKDIIFASYGLSDTANNHFDGLSVKNKWVMVIDGTPADMDSTADAKTYANMRANRIKPFEIKSKGINGLLIVKKELPQNTDAAMKGSMYLHEKKDSVPVLYISLQTASRILGQPLNAFSDLKKLIRGVYPTSLHVNQQITTLNLSSSNVVGVLPGTDRKGEYVFITSHYDHLGKKGNTIWYGADDDGSGTASVLQIATAFAKAKKEGHGPRRSIVFMTVSGEEKGLWGSEYYADHPLFPLDSTSVDLNIDMVGRIDPDYKGDSTNYVYTIGEDKLSSDLQPITDSVNQQYSNLELDRRFNDPNDPNRFYYRSDHFNFAKNGVPVIFYFNGVHADYHQPTDTVDKINFDLMSKRVKLVYYTAWAMANKDKMMKRDIPLK